MEKSSFDDEMSSESSTSASHRLLGGDHEVKVPKVGRKRMRWQFGTLILNCILLVVNTTLLASILRIMGTKRSGFDDVNIISHEYTDEAIQWEITPHDDIFHDHESPYRGAPRPELDAAWQKLMRGFDLRVPDRGWVSPSSPNFTIVQLTDGSGDGMAVPAFLHEIHCLRTIREYFFPEHYPRTAARYPHAPGEINVHVDHCIDGLRQAAMCHADMTLMNFEWWDRTPYPQVVTGGKHKCANWEKLTNWVQSHSFNSHGDIIRHPKTGVVPHPWDGTDPVPAHNAYWESQGEPWNKMDM